MSQAFDQFNALRFEVLFRFKASLFVFRFGGSPFVVREERMLTASTWSAAFIIAIGSSSTTFIITIGSASTAFIIAMGSVSAAFVIITAWSASTAFVISIAIGSWSASTVFYIFVVFATMFRASDGFVIGDVTGTFVMRVFQLMMFAFFFELFDFSFQEGVLIGFFDDMR